MKVLGRTLSTCQRISSVINSDSLLTIVMEQTSGDVLVRQLVSLGPPSDQACLTRLHTERIMGLISKSIALTPANGSGICISFSALRPADIIVSTTKAMVSSAIRLGTMSVVSHAALYAGDQIVIEAIGGGVTKHGIQDALADDVLTVAYRHPAMSAAIARAIIAFADKQVGQPYSRIGAILSPDHVLCVIAGNRSSGFFCSQLVAEAYRQVGLPLFDVPSQCVTPDDVVEIAQHRLAYVGHIKGDPSWFPVISP